MHMNAITYTDSKITHTHTHKPSPVMYVYIIFDTYKNTKKQIFFCLWSVVFLVTNIIVISNMWYVNTHQKQRGIRNLLRTKNACTAFTSTHVIALLQGRGWGCVQCWSLHSDISTVLHISSNWPRMPFDLLHQRMALDTQLSSMWPLSWDCRYNNILRQQIISMV